MRGAGVETEVMSGQAPQHLQQVGDRDQDDGCGDANRDKLLEAPELYLVR